MIPLIIEKGWYTIKERHHYVATIVFLKEHIFRYNWNDFESRHFMVTYRHKTHLTYYEWYNEMAVGERACSNNIVILCRGQSKKISNSWDLHTNIKMCLQMKSESHWQLISFKMAKNLKKSLKREILHHNWKVHTNKSITFFTKLDKIPTIPSNSKMPKNQIFYPLKSRKTLFIEI